MSAAALILTEIAQRGVTIRVDGQTLRLKPRFALDEFLLARIKQHKPEIIRAVAVEGCDRLPEDEYSLRMQMTLYAVWRGHAVALIPWLRETWPILYVELTERLPDRMQQLWETQASVEGFQEVLDNWSEAYRAAIRMYEQHLVDQAPERSSFADGRPEP